jgi:hypothetical protein
MAFEKQLVEVLSLEGVEVQKFGGVRNSLVCATRL